MAIMGKLPVKGPSRCPYCDRPMLAMGRGETLQRTTRTRDHILPKEWGGTWAAENMRPACRECNELRGRCGHCPAALMLAIGVAKEERVQYRVIVERWRLPMVRVLNPTPPKNERRAAYLLRVGVNPSLPMNGSKPGHLVSPSMIDANGCFVQGTYVNPELGPLGGIEWEDAINRIRARNEARIESSAEQLELRLAKAEARRQRKKAKAMAEERERINREHDAAAALYAAQTGSLGYRVERDLARPRKPG